MATYVGLETSGHVLLETTGGLLLETSTHTVPTGHLSVAFDDDPMQPDPDWTRIDTLTGCRVRGYSIDRGRPTEFDKTDVGTAVVHLVDLEGLFDPTNPSSYDVAPGKQAAIALLNPVNDTWHTLFRGYVESWRYALDPTEQYMELELQLVDGFAILARTMLEVGVDGAHPPFDDLDEDGNPLFSADQKAALNELAAGNILYAETETGTGTGALSDRIYAILATSTDHEHWPVELSVPAVDIFSGNVRVGPKAYGPGTSALDALWDCVDAEFPGVANLWIGGAGDRDAAGHLIFHGRQARFRPDVAEYMIKRYTVGDPSATPVDDEDVIPVAELEWSHGQDNLFNAASATPQWIGTGAAIRQIDPGEPHNDDIAGQYVKDTASITAHGLRSITFDNLLTVEGIHTGNNSMVETKLFATYYGGPPGTGNYSEPKPRISRIVFKSRRPDDPKGPPLWQFLCNVEISDLLTLRTSHPGGGGFDDEWFVEGIHYTGRPGSPDIPAIVELTLDLSPRANWTTNPFEADPDPEPA
jgi:hypothetical protein